MHMVNRIGFLLCCCLSLSCTGRAPERALPAQSPRDCGEPLTRAQLVEVAATAVTKNGGDGDLLEIDFELDIHEDRCEYVIVGKRQPPESQGHFMMRVTRQREVVSWPWCCVDSLKVNLGPP